MCENSLTHSYKCSQKFLFFSRKKKKSKCLPLFSQRNNFPSLSFFPQFSFSFPIKKKKKLTPPTTVQHHSQKPNNTIDDIAAASYNPKPTVRQKPT